MTYRNVIHRIQDVGLYLTCILLPIKLTLGYLGLIPLIVAWTLEHWRSIPQRLQELPSSGKYFAALFFSLALLAPFGINPTHSIAHFGTLFFFPLTILCVASLPLSKHQMVIHLLVTGTALACLLRLCEFMFQVEFPIIGAVSQSGQLALTIFVVLAWFRQANKQTLWHLVVSALIVSVFILNLKRGPWLGVAVMTAILLMRKRALYAAFFVSTATLLAFLVPPIYERLASSVSHFFIAGGRSEIWKIGLELISTYPLGIGFDNAGYLREFSVEIPKNLKHFHSNILNILVEGGWLCCYLYLAFVTTLAKEMQQRATTWATDIHSQYPLYLGLFASTIAGLVEYNFGDSAVVNLFYIILGLVYAAPAIHTSDTAPTT